MKNFMLYLVGTSGSGKTTIAAALDKELKQRGKAQVQFIDGDVIRAEFGDIFGYTFEERMKCNKVVRVLLKYLLRNNVSVILAQVGAYQEMRDKVRESTGESYIEVYVKCSYEECARRDVKGYYALEKKNQINSLNGANAIFEIPQNSDIVIDTEEVSVSKAVEMIIGYLEENGYDV